jgi:PAS domain S-box-containing protein
VSAFVTAGADARNRFLVALDDATRALFDPDEITRTAARLLGEYLAVNRCAYADVEADEDTFNLTGDYTNGVPSIVGRYTFAQFGREASRLMKQGSPFVIEDTETDPRTADVMEVYRRTKIRAVICVPLRKAGKFVAAMAVHQITARRWRLEDIELVQQVASRCWESIERTRITRELRESEERYRTLVENISAVVWVTDRDGAIVIDNPSWGQFTGQSFEEYSGWGWLDAIHQDDREHTSTVWRAALASLSPYEANYRLRRRDGEYRDVVARGAAVLGSNGLVKEWVGNCTDVTEANLAAAQLGEARERLEAALIAGEVATWVWHIPEDRVMGDRNLTRIFNLTEEEALGAPLARYIQAIDPEDREHVLGLINRSIESDPALYEAEYRIMQPDGGTRWVIARGHVERNAVGQALRMPAVVLDVTDRVMAEHALRDSEQRLRLAQRAGRIGSFEWLMSEDRVIWTPELEQLYGLEEGSFEGSIADWSKRVVPEDAASILTGITEAVEQRQSDHVYDFRATMPDGSIRWFRGQAQFFYDDTGAPVRMVGINLDIDEQKRASEALRQSEARFRVAIESAPNAMIIVDEAGKLSYINTQAEKMFGYSREQVIGEPADKLLAPAHRSSDAGRRTGFFSNPDELPLGKGQELTGLRSDGAEFPIEIGLNPVDASDMRAVLVAIVDITDRKLLEQRREELLESERYARAESERVSRMKDEFLATLSHELRTPLNAIMGWAHLLRRGGSAADLTQGLDTIERNARMQAQLIEDLLDMSSIVSGKVRLEVRRLTLEPVIQAAIDAVKPSADAKGVQVEAVIEPAAGAVAGDPARLQQIVWNLLTNAIKFSTRGGLVQVMLHRIDSQVELSVADTGKGIAPEFLPHVFERFRQADSSSTRRHGGLGLGLAIVKQLVEMHGGSVIAKSPGENQGATFVIQLPLAEDADEAQPQSGTDGVEREPLPRDLRACDLEGVQVLAVDDELDARNLVSRLLTDCGATVTLAASTSEALELIQGKQFDVLVCDISMPGEDGYTLIRKTRALGAEQGGKTPAIALTAFARSKDRVQAMLAGYNVHLSKPVEPQELIATVASLASGAMPVEPLAPPA